MSSTKAKDRLASIASHLQPSKSNDSRSINGHEFGTSSWYNIHPLSPTFFLPRAASIEPNACAIYHRSLDNKIIRRTYLEFADRARGFAYFLRKRGHERVGILSPNTPAFLESFFGINAAGAVNVAINYRLKQDDIAYIFDHAEVDAIVVDAEYIPLVGQYLKDHPGVPLIVNIDELQGQARNPFDQAVRQGLEYDVSLGSRGWAGLEVHPTDELSVLALAYTSGTTARPKGVEFTHRGTYLATLGNIIESGLSLRDGDRAKYLWTLPMFHAAGWTSPWAVTAVRGTHYSLRKIDYPEIWRLLKDEGITHYCAAPTVNTLLCVDPGATKLSNPVRVIVGASPPSAHLFESMINLNLQPVHVYGATESYGPTVKGYILPEWQDDPKEKYTRLARQGHSSITSLPCRVIKLDQPDDVIIDVEKDGKEMGEVCFLGNVCARGYYKDEIATKKLYAGGIQHSGDLAVWHPDGAIQIMDRAKDIIISGKIHPIQL